MKKVREGCKMTELGEIPLEWKVKKLEEVFEVCQYGISDSLSDGGIYPVLRMNNIRNGKANLDDLKFIDLDEDEFYKYSLNRNDILFNRTNSIDLVGKTGIYDSDELATFASYLIRIKTNSEIAQPKFVNYYMNSNKGQQRIRLFATLGVSQANINADNLKKVLIPIAPLKEQEKISSILSSLDEQIEITNNLIEKTKELKKGLMKKLLTKGIGHSKYKDTEIGKIPEQWEVRKLGEICEVKGGKRLPKGLQLIDEDNGFPYIRVVDMYMGGINTDDIKYVPLEAVKTIKNYRIDKEDLFISVAGTIGIVGEVPESLDEANLTENADKLCNIKINKEYLSWVLQSEFIQKIIDSEKTTNAQPKLALTRIKEFLLPIPSKDEQNEIALILSSINQQICEYELKKEKLQELKKGLMQKLLTGKIRV